MTSQYTTKLMLEISNVRDLTFVLLGLKSFLFVSFLLNVMGQINNFLFIFILGFYEFIYNFFCFFFFLEG